MSCNCMDTVLQKIEKKVRDDTKKLIVPGTIKTRWQGQTLGIDLKTGGVIKEVVLSAKCTMRLYKIDGTQALRDTTKEVQVRMSYCPFCGEKSGQKQEQAA